MLLLNILLDKNQKMVFGVCVGYNIAKIHACFNGMIVHPIRGSAIAPATVVAAGVSPA